VEKMENKDREIKAVLARSYTHHEKVKPKTTLQQQQQQQQQQQPLLSYIIFSKLE
jgi:hypothetical protein